MTLLDLVITNNVFYAVCFIILVSVIAASAFISQQKNRNHELEITVLRKDNTINEKDISIAKFQTEMTVKAQEEAKNTFEQWKKEELVAYMKVIDDAGIEKAQALLNQWKIQEEDRIRKDAANRSVRNVLGKVTEHLIPFSEAMKQFNPKDIRFIGTPIDLIVFEGAEELKKDQVTIWFIEVKTGTSALSKKQQLIKDAVINKRVEWLRVNMKDFGEEVNAALLE